MRPRFLTLLLLVLASGCQHKEEAPPPKPADPVELSLPAQPSSSAEPPRVSAHSAEVAVSPPPEGTGEVGVAPCDEYLRVWRDCFKDPAALEAAQPGLDAMVKAWKDAASQGEATRAAIADGCRIALEVFPRDACQ